MKRTKPSAATRNGAVSSSGQKLNPEWDFDKIPKEERETALNYELWRQAQREKHGRTDLPAFLTQEKFEEKGVLELKYVGGPLPGLRELLSCGPIGAAVAKAIRKEYLHRLTSLHSARGPKGRRPIQQLADLAMHRVCGKWPGHEPDFRRDAAASILPWIRTLRGPSAFDPGSIRRSLRRAERSVEEKLDVDGSVFEAILNHFPDLDCATQTEVVSDYVLTITAKEVLECEQPGG